LIQFNGKFSNLKKNLIDFILHKLNCIEKLNEQNSNTLMKSVNAEKIVESYKCLWRVYSVRHSTNKVLNYLT